ANVTSNGHHSPLNHRSNPVSSSSIFIDVTTFPPSFIRLTINGLKTGLDHCCCCCCCCCS
ncbi:unnamed protein product, partial [Rotaria sp. Silwood1]